MIPSKMCLQEKYILKHESLMKLKPPYEHWKTELVTVCY